MFCAVVNPAKNMPCFKDHSWFQYG